MRTSEKILATPLQGAVSLAFLHRLFEQKYMCASVRAIETIIKLFDFDL